MLSLLLATILIGTNEVSFTARSTDCGMDVQLEFLFVGPNSDRDYEAMFVTDDPVEEIAKAFAKAGIPQGRALSARDARFWAIGPTLAMKPTFKELVREMSKVKTPEIVFTGGSRDKNGCLESATNMPAAVFALYNCSQSMLQLNDNLDQSTTYGRFQPAVKIAKGEQRKFTFSWNGVRDWEEIKMPFNATNFVSNILAMKEKSEHHEVAITPDFASDITVKDAVAIAKSLAIIDSRRVKINGFQDGQFFYRAFLPDEDWRDRNKRLAQPPEVHIRDDGKIVVVEISEDWSGEDTLQPKLSAKEEIFDDVAKAGEKISLLGKRTSSALIFTSSTTQLKRLYLLREKVEKSIVNWYIFIEKE